MIVCPIIPKLNYGDLSEKLHNLAVKDRIPISCGLELTYSCNLNCVHCYVKNTYHEIELPTEKIFNILDDVAKEGCLWLLLTGGEPLVRKDFSDIYLYAKKKGFIITVFTNGTMITPEIISLFKEWPPFNIEITIYGATKKTYENVTHVSGSFEKCMNGINQLLGNNLPIQLKTIIMTLNKHEVGELKKFSNSKGMPFLFDPILSPKLNRSLSPRQYSLMPDEIVELDTNDPDRLKEWKEYFVDSLNKTSSNFLYRCSAGQTSFFINPFGEMQFCVLSRTPSYNLIKGNFRDGWYNQFKRIREQKCKPNYICKDCSLISICGQCPGWSYLEHGNFDTPVDYLCEIAHKRLEAFQERR
jgi:radical SAM protein with 4Fe4S-binding SPASM domain